MTSLDKEQVKVVLAVVGVAVLIVVAAVSKAPAQHHGGHHTPTERQMHNQFYKDLQRPDITSQRASCCNGDEEGKTGDCYQTKAKFEKGQWHALRREDAKWLAIPASKIIADAAPDGEAHLCAPDPIYSVELYGDSEVIFCFVPPVQGY